ncbi:hypothetical protein [Nocardioides iriomotensis]|uniref:Uncharacterized protein n=1 Tax=Nocardioides iriomotensis TaxID=715784 RepID=A0A4Q5J5A2_9ACTN|nr:hypothetical protein [Nocardioides iriomotensis]RYU13018.1 hypothetical protein ETU37_08755 [Nocardioides iriomotensis]
MRRTRTAVATTIAAALLLGGCSADDSAPQADQDPSPSATSTATDEATGSTDEGEGEGNDKPLPQGLFADLTFKGDTVSPNGERVDLGVGEKLTLRIDSDRPGELHVHSTPEQEISFPAGQSERPLVIDQPGVVDVEEHESGTVLLQLEVR